MSHCIVSFAILTSPPVQNGRHFGRQQIQMHFSDGNHKIPNRISLKFVPRSTINIKAAMVQVMA